MDILLPIANYPQFILNRYKEESQKASHLATPKKKYNGKNDKNIALFQQITSKCEHFSHGLRNKIHNKETND